MDKLTVGTYKNKLCTIVLNKDYTYSLSMSIYNLTGTWSRNMDTLTMTDKMSGEIKIYKMVGNKIVLGPGQILTKVK